MLNFYGNKFTSDINTKRNYRGYGEILQENLINKFSRRENVKFEDIFPENIHPALEILIGESNLKNFIKIGEKITKTPYTMGS